MGLVDKVADPQDGRAFMASLSAEGAELVERASRPHAASGSARCCMTGSPADAEAFQSYLERFAVSFDASKDCMGSRARGRHTSGDVPSRHHQQGEVMATAAAASATAGSMKQPAAHGRSRTSRS